MPSQTPNLDLYKVNGETDGNDTFNVDVVLNDNWDKLDAAVGQIQEDLGNVQVPDASLTQKGIVQLSNATDGTRENVAATEKAVGQAFQAGNERKAEVVAALVAIGVSASTSETWAQLIPKIAAVIRATGNATAADILAGKTASNASGPVTGSMPNRGAVTLTPGKSDQAIPAGYHNGSGKVAGVPVPAANVLAGTTIAGTAGTMPNRSAENPHMPGLANTVWAGDRYFIKPPRGFYDGGESWVTAPEPQLRPENIRVGVSVGGLAGTLKPNVAGSAILSLNIPEWTPLGNKATRIMDLLTVPSGTSLVYWGGLGGAYNRISLKPSSNSNCDLFLEFVNNGRVFEIQSFTNTSSELYFAVVLIDLMSQYSMVVYQGSARYSNSYSGIDRNYPSTLRLRIVEKYGWDGSAFSATANGQIDWA